MLNGTQYAIPYPYTHNCLRSSTVLWDSHQMHIGNFVFMCYFKSLRPRQNGCHFADDIFNRISLKENVWIPIKISLKLVPKVPINTISALVQIMAWRRPDDKPSSEPRMVSLPTHICVTRPQWVNSSNGILYQIRCFDHLMCVAFSVLLWDIFLMYLTSAFIRLYFL